MKTWTKKQLFTYISLFVLLAFRIPDINIYSIFEHFLGTATLPAWAENLSLIEHWMFLIYQNSSFILIGLVILINRDDLKSLNVDEPFLSMYVCSGFFFCRYYFWPVGWAAALLSIIMIILYRKKEFKFGNPNPWVLRISLLIVIGFILGLILISGSLNSTKIGLAIHWFVNGIFGVAAEEVIFRGLLWMFLKKLNWSEPKIVGLQAILFWLSHTGFIFVEPIFFWIIIPISSIIFGIITWRSRSLAPSTTAHIFINILWKLIHI